MAVAGGSTSDSTGGDCIFRSTIATTIASQGFLLNVTLAPANRVANDQEPVISVGPTSGRHVQSAGNLQRLQYAMRHDESRQHLRDRLDLGLALGWLRRQHIWREAERRRLDADGLCQ